MVRLLLGLMVTLVVPEPPSEGCWFGKCVIECVDEVCEQKCKVFCSEEVDVE